MRLDIEACATRIVAAWFGTLVRFDAFLEVRVRQYIGHCFEVFMAHMAHGGILVSDAHMIKQEHCRFKAQFTSGTLKRFQFQVVFGQTFVQSQIRIDSTAFSVGVSGGGGGVVAGGGGGPGGVGI